MKKIFELGIVALLLAFALILVSCEKKCPGGNAKFGECVFEVGKPVKFCKSKECELSKVVYGVVQTGTNLYCNCKK